MITKCVGSDLVVATQNIDNLMLDDALDVVSGNRHILPRIKLRGMIVEVLADRTGESKTHIGIDVDLADSHAGSLAQLFLGNADGCLLYTSRCV